MLISLSAIHLSTQPSVEANRQSIKRTDQAPSLCCGTNGGQAHKCRFVVSPPEHRRVANTQRGLRPQPKFSGREEEDLCHEKHEKGTKKLKWQNRCSTTLLLRLHF